MNYHLSEAKRKRLAEVVFPILTCITCNKDGLVLGYEEITCSKCGQHYPIVDNVPIMTSDPDKYIKFDKSHVVEHGYAGHWLEIIESAGDGLVLDLGSGNNNYAAADVIKLDVFPLPNVDVVGIAEALPFHDETFAVVLSGAVFEHVMNPFFSINNVHRVLKVDGEVYIETAFLQPVHAYPNHFFNMTRQGLQYLCGDFEETESGVQPHQYPGFTLKWILEVWANKLNRKERNEFLDMTVRDIIEEYEKNPFSKKWIGSFRQEEIEQFACGVYFLGRKRHQTVSKPGSYPRIQAIEFKVPTLTQKIRQRLGNIYDKVTGQRY